MSNADYKLLRICCSLSIYLSLHFVFPFLFWHRFGFLQILEVQKDYHQRLLELNQIFTCADCGVILMRCVSDHFHEQYNVALFFLVLGECFNEDTIGNLLVFLNCYCLLATTYLMKSATAGLDQPTKVSCHLHCWL